MIQKFRKKPVVIEAVQFKENNSPEILYWMGLNHVAGQGRHGSVEENGNLYIHTPEGTMEVGEGDFVIKGVAGEFYPCKPDIFEKTYELYEGSSSPDAGEKQRQEHSDTWDAAITFANNLCVQISDRYNNDDETLEACVANECAKKVRGAIGEYNNLFPLK